MNQHEKIMVALNHAKTLTLDDLQEVLGIKREVLRGRISELVSRGRVKKVYARGHNGRYKSLEKEK